jgi:geranylgeranylglycerol-phosphate geranylgeranyltransferase
MNLPALIQLARPANQLLVALAVLLGGWIVGADWLDSQLWLAALSTLLALGAGNAWNDLQDQAEDTINRPERPLPSGRVSQVAASIFAWLLALASLASAWPLGLPLYLTVLSCLALLYWYACRGKQSGLAGNLAIALLSGFALVFGALAVGADRIWNVLPPALLAAGTHLGREWAKDLEDAEGDQSAGRKSWALSQGAKRIRTVLLGLLILLALAALGLAALSRELIHLLATGLILAALLPIRRLDLSLPENAGRASRHLKRLLFAGLLLYLIWTFKPGML